MKNIKYILIGIVLICQYTARAQQDPQYTQYMYNTASFNPAYAGSNNTLNFNLLHRTQWVGLDGAPKTQVFTFSTPMKSNNALGLTVINDEIGPSEELYVSAAMSYVLPISKDVDFAFGISAGLHSLQVDYTKLNTFDPIDDQFQVNVNRLAPQIGLGSFIYSHNWYVGASVPNMLRTEHYDQVAVSTASERLHFYLIGGYVFQLNDRLKFKPATLVKVVSGAPLAYDLSANFLLNDTFTLGASYRLNAAVSALAGFQISRNLMIGYAYDFGTTELVRYNSGSHEVFLRFQISNAVKGRTSPRFF
ncbi:type IX secretion system membrane protein PorP/SprF [Seonamhaeicola sp.]|uniref:PorP/SprF family type IX secretion system membrane protein n=1 Tax=Seonamhaeicola sp. TaxID=1912245 RepID=UPI00260B4746|nr:type IX secretion system membrane protein PorP/SprF [Seonamhaeicola sp.]